MLSMSIHNLIRRILNICQLMSSILMTRYLSAVEYYETCIQTDASYYDSVVGMYSFPLVYHHTLLFIFIFIFHFV